MKGFRKGDRVVVNSPGQRKPNRHGTVTSDQPSVLVYNRLPDLVNVRIDGLAKPYRYHEDFVAALGVAPHQEGDRHETE